MPRRLDSLNLGGFAEPIDVDNQDLDAVVAMLGLEDGPRRDSARQQLVEVLEDLQTARLRTVSAGTVREDRRDLNRLAQVVDPDGLTKPLLDALGVLDEIRDRKPVLFRRLQMASPRSRFVDRIRTLEKAHDETLEVGHAILAVVSELRRTLELEDGRGKSRNRAALTFAACLHRIWTDFTDRPTSRQNGYGRERDPFGDFVDAAGKLLDPEFKGHDVARRAHELRRKSPSGEK